MVESTDTQSIALLKERSVLTALLAYMSVFSGTPCFGLPHHMPGRQIRQTHRHSRKWKEGV
jgi:hypothetical protein